MPEPLRREDRRPFALGDVLTSANPFANCAILLRNGVELRRLALALPLTGGGAPVAQQQAAAASAAPSAPPLPPPGAPAPASSDELHVPKLP